MMMSSNSSCNSGGRNQLEYYTSSPAAPFTPTQYQELEHQALIYKYLVSGVPVPHHLLSSVRSAPSSSAVGWAGCFQIGFGGKKVDPEPGRCRRTDGKKWRCAKEAYPDSKYCEKHMHRGKNRTKNQNKPLSLQVLISDSPTATSTVTTSAANSSSSSSTPSSSISQNYGFPTLSDYTNAYSNYQQQASCNYYESSSLYPFISPHASVDAQNLVLGSSSGNISNKHSRYWSGIKEETGGERSFFPEASRTIKGEGEGYNNNPYPPSAIPLSKNPPNDHYSHLQQQYQYYNAIQGSSDQREVDSAAPNSRDTNDTSAKNPFHQFFGEWPVKSNADSWLEDNVQGAGEEEDDDRDSCSQQHSGPTSTTQLSM